MQVVFTDPYYAAPHNRHTSPHLDADAAALHSDAEAKAAAASAKAKFRQSREALLHGDLHTGSIMVSDTTAYAIDTEFAFYGPMAFDVGKLLANLFMTFFALKGHESADSPREAQRAWVLETAASIWKLFAQRFIELWGQEGGTGAAYPSELFAGAADEGGDALEAAQSLFMRALFDDALLFGGCVIIRRIVGIAHNADFEQIEDLDVRSACERRALAMGRELLVKHGEYHSIDRIVELAQTLDAA